MGTSGGPCGKVAARRLISGGRSGWPGGGRERVEIVSVGLSSWVWELVCGQEVVRLETERLVCGKVMDTLGCYSIQASRELDRARPCSSTGIKM